MSALLPNTNAIPLEVLRARRAAAEVVRQFASGRLTNRQFEDQFYKAADYGDRFDDPVLDEMEKILWASYDDFKTHSLREGKHDIGPKGRRLLARWVMFLHTDFESASGPVRDLWTCDGAEARINWRAVPALVFVGACAMWLSALAGLGGVRGQVMAILGAVGLYAALWIWGLFDRRDDPLPECADEETSVWPFKTRDDFLKALAQPRMLSGVRSHGVLHAN